MTFGSWVVYFILFCFSVDNGFDEHDIPYDVLWLDIEHTDGKKYVKLAYLHVNHFRVNTTSKWLMN